MFGKLFPTHQAAAEYAVKQDQSGKFRAVYTNLNRLRPDASVDSVPSKSHIQCYSNLLLDFDRGDHEADQNATDEEIAEVERLRDAAQTALMEEIAPSFISTFSGNGYALIYRLRDHPVEGQEEVRRLLRNLGQRFEAPLAKLDASVHNPARLTRVCGTWNRKYPETPGRPHRRARLISNPELRTYVYTFPPVASSATGPSSDRRSYGLALKKGTDLSKELEKAGLEFITHQDAGNTYFDYHNLNHNGRGCLVAGRVHSTNTSNPRCSALVETPEHTVYHTCFSNNCEKSNQTRRALRVLRIEHVLAPVEFKFTDLGNAERLFSEYEDWLRYACDRKCWYHYDGTRWALDQTGEVHRLAAKTIRDMQVTALNENNDDLRQKLLKWGLKSESNAMLNNMVARAQTLAGFSTLSSRFDQDALLFNVANGTIDLRTGRLRPHDRADLISKLANVVYDPGADCPRWRRFLEEILPTSIVGFIQTAVGYTLSGDTRQKYIFMMIGEAGDNGKTTFIEALRNLFGDYAVNMNFNSLLPREDNGPSGDIARLVGARFASACESNEGQRLSIAMLKRLVGGGDTLTARRLYENEIEFIPTHKIWFATNYQPVVPARDNAAWNRVLKIPFDVSIPKEKQDKTLPEVLAQELPGILNWALEGWCRFQRKGLEIPPEIQRATSEYRDSQDIVKQWMDERTVPSEDTVLALDLYKDFTKHCQRTSGRGRSTNVMANKTFYKELRRLGFQDKKEMRGLTIIGLGLREQIEMYRYDGTDEF